MKKGFIYGFVVSMMHELSEKGTSDETVFRTGEHALKEGLGGFGMMLDEDEFHKFMDFNKELSDWGGKLEKGV